MTISRGSLYMIATILKSRQAMEATFAIIETFAKTLMPYAGAVTAFDGVDGVECQRKARSEWN